MRTKVLGVRPQPPWGAGGSAGLGGSIHLPWASLPPLCGLSLGNPTTAFVMPMATVVGARPTMPSLPPLRLPLSLLLSPSPCQAPVPHSEARWLSWPGTSRLGFLQVSWRILNSTFPDVASRSFSVLRELCCTSKLKDDWPLQSKGLWASVSGQELSSGPHGVSGCTGKVSGTLRRHSFRWRSPHPTT